MDEIEIFLARHKFKNVICERTIRSGSLTGKPCRAWLGYYQSDTPNLTMFYCRRCDMVYTYLVTEDGFVCIERSNKKRRIATCEEMATIR